MDRFVINANALVVLQKEDGETIPVKGGITADGFEVLSIYPKGWLTFAYLKDHQGIWWFNARSNKARRFSQDTAAFRVVHEDYGCDSQHVYLEDKPVSPSDPDSFELLPGTPYFAKDKHQLYVKDSQHFHLFNEIDTSTVIAMHDYCTDLDHLFHLSSGLRYANEYKYEMVDWLRSIIRIYLAGGRLIMFIVQMMRCSLRELACYGNLRILSDTIGRWVRAG